MASRLPKRLLELADFKDTKRLQEVLNRLIESHTGLLNGGVSLDNLRAITVTAKVKPPDEWTPLTLPVGYSVFAGGQRGVPGVRWTSSGIQLRGMLVKPSAGVGALATVPDALSTLRPKLGVTTSAATSSGPGYVDVNPDGTVSLGAPSGFTAGGWVSLWGVGYETGALAPPWASYVDVTLLGPNGQDYGTPALVVVLGATRPDRTPCLPDFIPMWESPVVGTSLNRERKLRIRRVGGLAQGIEHLVTFLCLYRG